jgi:hypothetical protein
MRVRVARKQRRLKKQHAGSPHRGPAAEPGQDEPSHHRLNLKKQEGAEKNRYGKKHREQFPTLTQGISGTRITIPSCHCE